MTKYLLKRLLHGLLSILAVVFIVMLLVYSCIDKEQIFAADVTFSKMSGNQKEIYKYQQWEKYGYLDYVSYAEWLVSFNLSEDEREEAMFGNKPEYDSDTAKEYVAKFTKEYEKKGYTVVRLNYSKGKGNAKQLFAYKNINIFKRFWKYITGVVKVDNIHYASGIPDAERGISFTWHDPVYGGKKFAPAIMGNGTKYKYLFYFDGNFPFIHQNILTISLGTSYGVNTGTDVWATMTNTQGGLVRSDVVYPTGYAESTADNLHTAMYVEGSLNSEFNLKRYTDDYTSVRKNLNGLSQMGYSFAIGIFSVIIAYLLGLPLGVLMAKNKDKVFDKLGTIYIIFIIAVPSLAYIFMFKAIGVAIGLPTTFKTGQGIIYFMLPIISLALPSVGSLMKWMRRYMIDQASSDYVKFARSGGLSEGQIFTKHIMKNAAIPILHGIPGSILGSLTGAIITESVYVVPGVGRVLTQAINAYDNSVIIGVTLFYAVLSVLSLILGDIMMSLADPRISFTAKER